MTAPDEVAKVYLREVRRIRSTGHATGELSFYTPLSNFIGGLVADQRPLRRVLSHPQGIEGDFPDVALYEVESNVLVLPLEVKGADADMASLVRSDQARRYASTFGGGKVLLTNLHEFVLARLSGTVLEAVDSVQLVTGPEELDNPRSLIAGSAERLQLLLEQACQVRGTLSNPQIVASFLAYHAKRMSNSIHASGEEATLLNPIRQALSDGLHIDLAPEFLVATVVQTLVYGLFAAWLDAPSPLEFNWMDAAYRLDVPVFADVLHASLSPALVHRCNLNQHLDSVGRVLSWVNRESFEAGFDGGAIEYFYEPFLAEFDSELRDRLGVWYTPRQIAEYQVARVDHHLKENLGIVAGLADPSVYILDPACGTGTYLAAVLRFIKQAHEVNNEPDSIVLGRVREAALTRVLGFEILPSAFIVSHIHLSRLLRQMGADPLGSHRLRVFLTNSLTGWRSEDSPVGPTLFPQLAEELHDASVVKHNEPVLVILGNPPYQGYSSAETDEEKAFMRPWIEPLWPVWGLRKHRLNDLYVRFWRVSIEKISAMTGRGVISFITNRKWLGGRSYPSMRDAVATSFQTVIVDDLHGAVDDSSHPGDQSIFSTLTAGGITRGTAIVTAIRTGALEDEECAAVEVRDFWGSSSSKRDRLVELACGEINDGLRAVPVFASTRWRFVSDSAGDYPQVDEYFPFNLSGVQPVRDDAVIAFTRGEIEQRMRDFFDPELSLADLIERYPGFAVTRRGYDPTRTRANLLAHSTFHPERIVPFLYRPFDVRWLYWEPDEHLLHRPRSELMPYWLTVPEQRCLVLPQTPRRVGAFRPLVSRAVASFACAEPDARIFPMFCPGEVFHGVGRELSAGHLTTPPKVNVSNEWIEAARLAGVTGDDSAIGCDIFYAAVAVMNSAMWLSLQSTDADDFPQVPLPRRAEDFRLAAVLGRLIADLVDPMVEVAGVTSGLIDTSLAGIGVPDSVDGHVELEYGTYGSAGGRREGDAVLWSASGGWRGISDDVWSFASCGHSVLPKWLSYRRVTGLTPADREAFTVLCRRIAKIRSLESECDAAYLSADSDPLQVV